MRISNLRGVFTGQGFQKKSGRKPSWEDCGFISGPIDITTDHNGKIQSLAAHAKNSTEATYDGSSFFATAAFVDSHTHALFQGSRAPEFFQRWKGSSYAEISASGGGIHNTARDVAQASDFALEEGLKIQLRHMLLAGSACVEVKTGYAADAAGELRLLRLLKKIRDQKDPLLPAISITFLGLHALPKGKTEKSFVDEMLALLPTLQKEGLADFIDAFPEKGFFGLEESLRFVEGGLKIGLRPKIHADEITDMKATEAFTKLGALSVDHLQKVSAAGVQALAASQTVATLLPATSFYLGLDYTDARKLLEAGCVVALATDFNPGTAPNPTFSFTNLLAASKLKMTAAEILCATTHAGARALGLKQNSILAAGEAADILLWSSELSKGPEVLEDIFLSSAAPGVVIKAGKPLIRR